MVVIVHVKKRIAPHWVLRVASFGIIVDYRKSFVFPGAVLIVEVVEEYS